MTQALLLWLVLYVGLLAAIGFVLFVGRGFSGRQLSNVTLLRVASTLAFVLALAMWVALLILD